MSRALPAKLDPYVGISGMATPSQSNRDAPPSPGGDPDQPDSNIPVPPAGNERDVKDRSKNGYGHTGNREQVPLPEGAPRPHRIF
jgi:hypothetical protein